MSSPRVFGRRRGSARRGLSVARARFLRRRIAGCPDRPDCRDCSTRSEQSGRSERLGQPGGAARGRRLEQRPAGIPRFWRRVDDTSRPVHAASLPPSPPAPVSTLLARRASSAQLDLWLTVLSAANIPFRLGEARGTARRPGGMVYVPPLLERRARADLAAVAAERPAQPPAPVPARRNAHWVLVFLLALIVWHGLRAGWWEALTPASAPLWIEAGAADVFRIVRLHEWHRTVTSLTLHSDSRHLFANVLFGAPFLMLLCRRVGLGPGLALTVFSGALGNTLNSLYQPLGHSSIGFSTALFGAVGALAGVTAVRGARVSAGRGRFRRIMLPLAVGGGVLAMLGAEGGATDYGAHLFGLVAGCFLGGAAGLTPPLGLRAEQAVGISALLLLAGAWQLALAG